MTSRFFFLCKRCEWLFRTPKFKHQSGCFSFSSILCLRGVLVSPATALGIWTQIWFIGCNGQCLSFMIPDIKILLLIVFSTHTENLSFRQCFLHNCLLPYSYRVAKFLGEQEINKTSEFGHNESHKLLCQSEAKVFENRGHEWNGCDFSDGFNFCFIVCTGYFFCPKFPPFC